MIRICSFRIEKKNKKYIEYIAGLISAADKEVIFEGVENEEQAKFLMECGMGCIYCPASQMETLAEACAVHGIDSEEIVDALNDYLMEHNA